MYILCKATKQIIKEALLCEIIISVYSWKLIPSLLTQMRMNKILLCIKIMKSGSLRYWNKFYGVVEKFAMYNYIK